MSGDMAAFQGLKDLSTDLEKNLNTLEFEVSDASRLLYDSENQLKSDSKGIFILQEILKQHTKICDKLEQLFQNEESDLETLSEELDTFTKIIHEREQEQREMEDFLIEQNLIHPEESQQSNLGGADNNSAITVTITPPSPQPSASCDSTFLIPHTKHSSHTPDSVNSGFQSTMFEY